MSEDRPEICLHFSRVFAAFQFVFMGAAAVGFAYLVLRFWFHFDEVSAGPVRARYAWFEEIVESNDGKTGAVIWTAFAVLTGWYCWTAGRRFLSKGSAAMLTRTGLRVHPIYRRSGEIPFADILGAGVSRGRHFTHVLHIGIARGRPIRIASKEIEGGKAALKAFASELNARRLAARPIHA